MGTLTVFLSLVPLLALSALGLKTAVGLYCRAKEQSVAMNLAVRSLHGEDKVKAAFRCGKEVRFEALRGEVKKNGESVLSLKEDDGQGVFPFLFLTAVFSFFYLTVIDYMQRASLDGQIKRQSHLCLAYTIKAHRQTVARLNSLNAAIQGINLLAVVTPKALAAKKGLQKAQDVLFYAFWAKMSSNRYCNALQKASALRGFPYRKKGLVRRPARSLDGTLLLKDKKWTISIPSMFFKKVPESAHLLTAAFEMEDKYSRTIKKTSSMKAIGDFRRWRFSLSPPSLPLSASSVPG